jgi:LysM repeat protein
VRVIDHNWIQIVRVSILLIAVLVTWRILDWQEQNYASAAREAAQQHTYIQRPAVVVMPETAAVSLPTIRPVIPRVSPSVDELTESANSVLVVSNEASRPTEYSVVAGDILSQIADKFRVPLEVLMEVNNISNPDQIQVGLVLQIPNPSRLIPVEPERSNDYLVQPGDTLQGIADRYDIDIRVLQSLNGIKNPDAIFPGTSLKMP